MRMNSYVQRGGASYPAIEAAVGHYIARAIEVWDIFGVPTAAMSRLLHGMVTHQETQVSLYTCVRPAGEVL